MAEFATTVFHWTARCPAPAVCLISRAQTALHEHGVLYKRHCFRLNS